MDPFVEGLDAFCLGGAAFFDLRGSLLLLRWPFAIAGSFGHLMREARHQFRFVVRGQGHNDPFDNRGVQNSASSIAEYGGQPRLGA